MARVCWIDGLGFGIGAHDEAVRTLPGYTIAFRMYAVIGFSIHR
ncbi:hypothetical protein CCP3SC1_1180006 [Gammaproteobacteria bacterium]